MNEEEKALLAHEKGSGSPCLKCGPKCEGLDLHFWRKTCKNCRCKEEDHQIPIQKLDIQKTILKNVLPSKNDAPDPQKKAKAPGGKPAVQPKKKVVLGGKPEVQPKRTVGLNGNLVVHQTTNGVELVIPQTDGQIQEQLIQKTVSQPEEAVQGNEMTKPQDSSQGMAKEGDSDGIDVLKDLMSALEDLESSTITKYMDALPKDKTPQHDDGMHYRQKQLRQQLPAHDFDATLCDDLTEDEKDKMNEFNKKRSEEASGQGAIKEQSEMVENLGLCVKCNKEFQGGEVVIFAERAGTDKRWHPECFVCHNCSELLVDLIYFFKDENIYCGRHYGELAGIRCAACDELIFTTEYTIAGDKSYHMKHFCCYECDKELGGLSYVPKEGNPYCMDCYGVKFSKTCYGCQQSIPPDAECLGYEEFYWHSNEACFNCCVCKANLVGQQFVFKDKQAFCSSECVASRFSNSSC